MHWLAQMKCLATIVFILAVQFGSVGLASARPVREPLQKRIHKSDPAKYREVRNAKDWKNPYLIVHPTGVQILGVTSTEPGIAIESIGAALERLPRSAWPYSLVVAIQDVSIQANGDAPRIRANRKKLLRVLKQLGVAVDLWP